jgi:hypothetical protein
MLCVCLSDALSLDRPPFAVLKLQRTSKVGQLGITATCSFCDCECMRTQQSGSAGSINDDRQGAEPALTTRPVQSELPFEV